MKRIVAVDPGGTTGIAMADFFSDGTITHSALEAAEWQLAAKWVDGQAWHVLVSEKFTIRGNTHKLSPQYDALYLNGALQWFAHERGRPFVFQEPGAAKSIATNERLEEMGWRFPTRGGHADDASRHLLLYALTNGLVDAGRFL